MAMLRDKFRGCLLGAAIGDIIGAVAEAESPAYIASEFASIDDILSTDTVPEFTGPPWQVGKFTDDTQMTHCVAEWLLEGDSHSAEDLLARFAEAYEPWRRYGSGTEAILRMFPEHRESWRELSTMMFPDGSHGNGCAMRVAPVGLAYSNDPARLKAVAIESSRPTHSHWLAYQGAVLQAVAVARATWLTQYSAAGFLRPLRASLASFADLLQITSQFGDALDMIEQGLSRGVSCAEMSPKVTACHTFSPPSPPQDYNCDATDNITTRHPTLATLTSQQNQAIDLLIRGLSDGAVASKVGLCRRTILRWRNSHPAFIAELNARQQQLLAHSALRYRRTLNRSFKILNATLKKSDSPDAIRVALALVNGNAGRKALNQEIGPTNPIAVVNAMAAEEERRLEGTNSDPYVHQEFSDRLAQLDQLAQAQEAQT